MKRKKLKPAHLIFISIIFVFLAICGPLLINALYINNAGYETCWEAKDVLSYFGSVLGGIATIVAIILTILYTEQQLRINHKHDINITLADLKKAFIEEKYRKVYEAAERIRSCILLDFFDDSIWTHIFHGTKWIDELYVKFRNLEFELAFCTVDRNDETKLFIKETLLFRSKIIEKLSTMPNDIDEVEKKFEEKNVQAKKYTIKLGAISTEKENENNETTKDVIDRYKSKLVEYRDDYRYEYIAIFDRYMKYLKSSEETEIRKLYENLKNNIER